MILEGKHVRLIPLEEKDIPELIKNSREEIIWKPLSINGMDEQILIAHYLEAIEATKKGEEYAFVIEHKETKEIIGSTRYLDIQTQHKKLEIGWTWIQTKYWGTKINPECKYLLLKHAFEELKCIRVQLKTNEENIRSQKAMEKIGAKREGILRKWRTRYNGTVHNVHFFSIIDEEWPEVKRNLEKLLN